MAQKHDKKLKAMCIHECYIQASAPVCLRRGITRSATKMAQAPLLRAPPHAPASCTPLAAPQSEAATAAAPSSRRRVRNDCVRA